MAPIVVGLTPEYEDTVAIRTYDVESDDEGIALADEYGVEFVPTFVFVDAEGTVVDTIIGAVSEDDLRDALDSL